VERKKEPLSMSERYLEDFFVEHSLPVGCESHESK